MPDERPIDDFSNFFALPTEELELPQRCDDGESLDPRRDASRRGVSYFIECKPTMLPSVSTTSAMNPYSPMGVFGF